jgi:hypothetical protein
MVSDSCSSRQNEFERLGRRSRFALFCFDLQAVQVQDHEAHFPVNAFAEDAMKSALLLLSPKSMVRDRRWEIAHELLHPGFVLFVTQSA